MWPGCSVRKAHLYVILLRLDWRSSWAGGSGTHRAPSLCSSSPPAARDTFLLEIFSLMAFAISIILRNKYTKQMESPLDVTAQGGSAGGSGTRHAPGPKDRVPKVAPRREADKIPHRAIGQFHFNERPLENTLIGDYKPGYLSGSY